MLFWTFSQSLNGHDQVVTLGEPLVQVIPPLEPFMVSDKPATRDEPKIGLRCSRNVHVCLFLDDNAEVLSGETVFHPMGPICQWFYPVKQRLTRWDLFENPALLFQRDTQYWTTFGVGVTVAAALFEYFRGIGPENCVVFFCFFEYCSNIGPENVSSMLSTFFEHV